MQVAKLKTELNNILLVDSRSRDLDAAGLTETPIFFRSMTKVGVAMGRGWSESVVAGPGQKKPNLESTHLITESNIRNPDQPFLNRLLSGSGGERWNYSPKTDPLG